MAACVLEHTIHLPCLPGHIQVACDGVQLTAPVTKTTVGVWNLQDITDKPVELIGHRQPITCLSLSCGRDPSFLCSAAEDYVIVWDVEKCKDSFLKGEKTRGVVIGTCLGHIQQSTFSPDDSSVAVCADRLVYILTAHKEQTQMTLEGHTAPVTCVQFSPHLTSLLVSAGEDRTFKIWDVSEQTLVYQSSVISASPFLCLAMDPLQPEFALGASDGQVRIFDMSEGGRFHCIHQMEVDKILNKWQLRQTANSSPNQTGSVSTVSSLPSWQRDDFSNHQYHHGDIGEGDSLCEAGVTVLSLCYVLTVPVRSQRSTWSHAAKLPFLSEEKGVVSELLETTPSMVIATTSAVITVNGRTLELQSVISLQDPIPVLNDITVNEKVISLAGSAVLMKDYSNKNSKVWSILGSLLRKELYVVSLDCASHLSVTRHENDGATEESPSAQNKQISVLSSVPLLESSPLNAEMVRKSKTETPKKKSVITGSQGSAGQLNRKGQIVDKQPIVFHSKIKSSGYTQAPRKDMFTPKINKMSNTPAQNKKLSKSGAASVKAYPVVSSPPTKLITRINVADRPTPITDLCFSGDGQHLACSSANKSAQIFRLPITEKSRCLIGHNGKVNTIRWSHDNKWLLTSSDDKTSCVWNAGTAEKVMTFTKLRDNLSEDKDAPKKVDRDNPCFSQEIKFAQFYYMDKFILLTIGNTFYMYKFSLDPTKSDVKRYVDKSKYKLVQAFTMEQTQNITALSAVNSFYSYLVLCAGSNKCLDVFDLNCGQTVVSLSEIHQKPAHVIRQNEGSAYATLSSDAYDLFVTAAMTDCIKLWDLRTASCVRRYEGHQNRCYPCSLALSPCGHYIATGAEDKSAYIYDMRVGTYLHKLTGHTDTVAGVAFNPLQPQMITATLDGKLGVYTDIT